ncbi:MAG: NifU family protein [Myxococcota bacterium]|nr:NifU family protein [Myxococcota bacterium]
MMKNGETPSLADADAGSSAGDHLEVEIDRPADEAVTCRIQFSEPVSPEGTSLFEIPEAAAEWPAVRALLEIPGVHSVIGKGDLLVLARREDTAWPEILNRVEQALTRASMGHSSEAASPAFEADEDRDPEAEAELRARVEKVVEERINPGLDSHGGYLELLDVRGTKLYVHMGGGCQGCAMSAATLKQGVESILRTEIPEISEVLDTTDHDAGENPYFAG